MTSWNRGGNVGGGTESEKEGEGKDMKLKREGAERENTGWWLPLCVALSLTY